MFNVLVSWSCYTWNRFVLKRSNGALSDKVGILQTGIKQSRNIKESISLVNNVKNQRIFKDENLSLVQV